MLNPVKIWPDQPALNNNSKAEILALLANYGRSKIYDKEIIIRSGDAANKMWLVQSGWVKLTRQTPDGKESIVGLCTEGDVFGEAALSAGNHYNYNVETIAANTILIAIPASAIADLLVKNPTIAPQIMLLLHENIAEAQLKLEQMSTMSATQRIGCFLLRLCHAEQNGSKIIQIPVGKNVLATYLGMKAETFSRSQAHLKALNIEIIGQQISIGDIGKLREFVCSSCSKSGNCAVESAAL